MTLFPLKNGSLLSIPFPIRPNGQGTKAVALVNKCVYPMSIFTDITFVSVASMSPSGKLLAAQPAPLIFYIHDFTFLGKPFIVLFSLPLSITQVQILSSHNLNLF